MNGAATLLPSDSEPLIAHIANKSLGHLQMLLVSHYFILQIHNGNRTEWSPIRSVIIRVINEIGRPHSRSPICLITSMITDRIGWYEVLLPINCIYSNIRPRKRRKPSEEGIDNSFNCKIRRRKKNLFKCN